MHQKILFFCADGLPYLVIFGLLSLGLSGWCFFRPQPVLFFVTAMVWLLFLEMGYFFRDPERVIPPDPKMIVAPADGKVLNILTLPEDVYLKGKCRRVSIFMNVFNVHVNRAPLSGKVTYYHYHPGKFISAFKEKASLDNEQVLIGIAMPGKGTGEQRVLVKLIAGLIARRIVVWKREGDLLAKGERMSVIKFGSRVDLFLPLEVEIKVKPGDQVKAGETVIAHFVHP